MRHIKKTEVKEIDAVWPSLCATTLINVITELYSEKSTTWNLQDLKEKLADEEGDSKTARCVKSILRTQTEA